MAPAPQTGTGDPTDSTPTSTSSTSTAEVAVIIVWILCCVVLFIVGALISRHRRRMATITEFELDDQSDVSRPSTDTYESRAPRQVPAPVRTLISISFLRLLIARADSCPFYQNASLCAITSHSSSRSSARRPTRCSAASSSTLKFSPHRLSR